MTTPEIPSDPPLRVGWLREGPFGFTAEGQGPTVLALHGLPGSVRDFRWLAAALRGRVRLVRVEQPGFGQTPLSTGPGPTLEARVRFARDAMDALQIEDAVLVGHSMGGPLALALAASLRTRAKGLALLASVGLRPHRLARRANRYPLLGEALRVPVVRSAFGPVLRAGFSRAGFPRSTPEMAMVQSVRIFAALRFESIRRAARQLEAPTMIAWTEDDRLVEPSIGMELAGALPGGPRLAFEDGGHNLQKTRAEELAEALADFARSTSVRG